MSLLPATTIRWFGASWDAPVCETENHVPTPAGRSCMRCGEPIAPSDQGLVLPFLRTDGTSTDEPWHLECFRDSIRPCPGCHHCQPERYAQ